MVQAYFAAFRSIGNRIEQIGPPHPPPPQDRSRRPFNTLDGYTTRSQVSGPISLDGSSMGHGTRLGSPTHGVKYLRSHATGLQCQISSYPRLLRGGNPKKLFAPLRLREVRKFLRICSGVKTYQKVPRAPKIHQACLQNGPPPSMFGGLRSHRFRESCL